MKNRGDAKMKFNLTFEKIFTYDFEVEAESLADARERADYFFEKESDKDFNLLDHSQESYWELIDISEVE